MFVLFFLLMLFFCQVGCQCTRAEERPEAGVIEREIKMPELKSSPQAPPSVKGKVYKPEISRKKGIKVLVRGYKFAGNTVYSDSKLLSLIKDYINKELTIGEIIEAADRITSFYRQHGYIAARAYVPEQSLDKENAVVRINILEGRYGKFQVKNNSLVKDRVIQGYLEKLRSEKAISLGSLNRQLLLINDLEGLVVKQAELFPGERLGYGNLALKVDREKRVSGYVVGDNYGNKYTGCNRLLFLAKINSPAGRGGDFSIGGIQSHLGKLRNGRLGYSVPVGYRGLKLFLNTSYTEYRIGGSLKDLGMEGAISRQEVGASYPLVRSTGNNISVAVKYVHRDLKEEDDIEPVRRKNIDSVELSFENDFRFALFKRWSAVDYQLTYTYGDVSMNDYARSIDYSGVHGKYSKLSGILNCDYLILSHLTLVFNFAGQISLSNNLDSVEEFTGGGPYGVRAYRESELSGDEGYLLRTALRYDLPVMAGVEQSVSCFLDHTRVRYNKDPVEGADKSRELSAVGIGYGLTYKHLIVQTSFAFGFGPDRTPVSGGGRLYRWFMQIGCLF